MTVEYDTLEGERTSYEAKDLMAVVIQHEIDHLDGILINAIGNLIERSPNMQLTKPKSKISYIKITNTSVYYDGSLELIRILWLKPIFKNLNKFMF